VAIICVAVYMVICAVRAAQFFDMRILGGAAWVAVAIEYASGLLQLSPGGAWWAIGSGLVLGSALAAGARWARSRGQTESRPRTTPPIQMRRAVLVRSSRTDGTVVLETQLRASRSSDA
jgi:hypothetical protein